MEDIEQKFSSIRVHEGPHGPALHKPLLLLLALGQCYQGANRLRPFSFYDMRLQALFSEFNPNSSDAKNAHYPFGKLENDGLWEIENSSQLSRTGAGHLLRSELLDEDIHGGFTEEIYDRLITDDELILRIAQHLLDRFFPVSQHSSILWAVYLPERQRSEFTTINPPTQVSPAKPLPNIVSPTEGKLTLGAGNTSLRQNQFIAYLNSLHNVGASGANALAESQALNTYFYEIYEPFPIVNDILSVLRGNRDSVVVLTGHAGDGKSTVALDAYKQLMGLPLELPLESPLQEREQIIGKTDDARSVSIVKDMSELSADRRLEWLDDAFGDPGSWLIVSNTGPLLNSLSDFAERRQVAGQRIESKILAQLNRPYNEGRIEEHILSEFPKDLLIINMTRLDNVRLGARLLTRMVQHSAWSECTGCDIEEACPLRLNRQALISAGDVPEERIRWLYRRLNEYEQRLTLRQMVAHLAFSLTGGMNCSEAKSSVKASTGQGLEGGTDGLENILFSEGLFGYQKGEPSKLGGSLRAVELLRRQVFGGPIGTDFERQLSSKKGMDWGCLPHSLSPLARRWSERTRAAEGVRWRFAQRRMHYIFATSSNSSSEASSKYIDSFLQSPRLRDYDMWLSARSLTESTLERKRLRNACLRVLLETYSGFSAGQFRADHDRLYLTLRRPDRAVIQPTQLVMAILHFDDFSVDYDVSCGHPTLNYKNGILKLPLTLPLLDFIEQRHSGDLGNELAQIHLAQLEWFRAEILRTVQESNDQEGFGLLRAGIDGQVYLHRYHFDNARKQLEVEQ